jgi:hypothetical protein
LDSCSRSTHRCSNIKQHLKKKQQVKKINNTEYLKLVPT